MKSKDLQPRLLYPAKLSFRMEGEIKNFPGKKKLKEFITTNVVLQEVFKVMKTKDLQPRLLYSPKLPFRIKGQIKCFPDKVKLNEFIITKPLLHEMLKGLI